MILRREDIRDTGITSYDLSGITEIGAKAFQGCSSLTTLLNTESLEIIGDFAFSGTPITTGDFPNVRKVGNYAFFNCTSLESCNLPEATWLGPGIFKNCTSLRNIEISNAEKIQIHTFKNCLVLSSAVFPNCSFISTKAFEGCKSLRRISCNKLNKLGNYAFQGCSSLERFAALKLSEVGNFPFLDCKNLEELYLGNSFPLRDPVSLIGDNYLSSIRIYVPSERIPNFESLWNSVEALPKEVGGIIFSIENEEHYIFFDEDMNPTSSLLEAFYFKNLSEKKECKVVKSLIPEGRLRWGEVNPISEKISEAFETSRGYSPSPEDLKDYILSRPELSPRKNVWTTLPEGWTLGSKEDLENLKSFNDTPFLTYKIWSSTERTPSEAYLWYPKDSEDRDEYGYFKSLFIFYMRVLYLNSDSPSLYGLNPQAYSINPIRDEFEEKNGKDLYASWFNTLRISVDDFEGRITPVDCFRIAFNDCRSGFQSYTDRPYFLIHSRDDRGEEQVESPLGFYTVSNIKNLSGERWITKTTEYPSNSNLDTHTTILPIHFRNDEFDASTGDPLPRLNRYFSQWETPDDFLRDIYHIFGEIDGESEVASGITLNDDLISYVPRRIIRETEVPENSLAEVQWTTTDRIPSRGILAETLDSLSKYSSLDGTWHSSSKREFGSTILIKSI